MIYEDKEQAELERRLNEEKIPGSKWRVVKIQHKFYRERYPRLAYIVERIDNEKPSRKGERHPMTRKRNPMKRGYSQKTISENIRREIERGQPKEQASAMAYESARQAWRRRHPKGQYPLHLRKPSRRKNPKRTALKKSHLWQVATWSPSAKKVAFLGGGGFTLIRADALLYRKKEHASSAGRIFAENAPCAIVSEDAPLAEIKAALLGKA